MRGNNPKRLILQKRDLEFFKILGKTARLVDREQAMKFAGFTSQSCANARLLKLTVNGFLRRYFLGTLKGGSKALYTLSARGALLAEVENHPVIRNKEALLVGDPFVNHQLAINGVHIAARFTCPKDFKFLGFRSFTEPITKSLALIPDGYFEIETPTEIKPAFIEVDCGSESLKIWSKKISLYLHLAISGTFEKLFQHEQFRVLVVTPSDRRLKTIQKTIVKQTQKIFWLTSLEQIKRDGFWSAIWQRPAGDQKLSLIERNL